MFHRFRFTSCLLLIMFMVLVWPTASWALITGGVGNDPLHDPGWLPGADKVFNSPSRVAYWEGPPFGGGQYVAECRGDTAAFNAVLQEFAKIDAKKRILFVHDGVGKSFWLNPGNDEAKRQNAEIDWTFTAWIPKNWKRFRPGADARPDEEGPFPELHLYTSGRVKWEDVKVPDGIDVVDERLESHGFSENDGTVIEGRVLDLDTQAGLVATVELQLIKPLDKGGYEYETTTTVMSDNDGRWVLRLVPAGWYQLVARQDGYIPRVIGYESNGGRPSWRKVETALAKPGPVSGIVVDTEGAPLEGVRVRFDDLIATPGEDYSVERETNEVQTDAAGRFTCSQVPKGTARIWIYKQGYCRPGLGLDLKTPASDVTLTMVKSSQVEVNVDFSGTERSEGYLVEIEPEGGSVVGSWGGSGQIDAENKVHFRDVPPGRYVLKGHPNPGGAKDETESVTVELKGGETLPISLKAK